MFPGGHPSKYWLGSMLLNFSDRTRTGVFNMIWPLARVQENLKIGFQQKTYLLTYVYEILHTGRVETLSAWTWIISTITHWFLEHFQQSQTLISLFWALLCTKYFKWLGKTWEKLAICNLSIFKPMKPDLLFESRLYNPQTILSTFDKHHSNISRYFESPLTPFR